MSGDYFDPASDYVGRTSKCVRFSGMWNDGEILPLPERATSGTNEDNEGEWEVERVFTAGVRRKRNYPAERRVNSMKKPSIPGVQGFSLREDMKELKQKGNTDRQPKKPTVELSALAPYWIPDLDFHNPLGDKSQNTLMRTMIESYGDLGRIRKAERELIILGQEYSELHDKIQVLTQKNAELEDNWWNLDYRCPESSFTFGFLESVFESALGSALWPGLWPDLWPLSNTEERLELLRKCVGDLSMQLSKKKAELAQAHRDFVIVCIRALDRGQVLSSSGYASEVLKNLIDLDVPGKMLRLGWENFLEQMYQTKQVDDMEIFLQDAYKEVYRLRNHTPSLRDHWNECLEGLDKYVVKLRDLKSMQAARLRPKGISSGASEIGDRGITAFTRYWNGSLSAVATAVMKGWSILGRALDYAAFIGVGCIFNQLGKP